MKIEELIQKLPKEYRELAYRYIPLILDMGFEELKAWVEMMTKGNWQKAYQNIVAKMSTDAVLAEEKKAHEILKRLNKDNAERIAAQFAIIEQIFLILLLMLRKEIEE